METKFSTGAYGFYACSLASMQFALGFVSEYQKKCMYFLFTSLFSVLGNFLVWVERKMFAKKKKSKQCLKFLSYQNWLEIMKILVITFWKRQICSLKNDLSNEDTHFVREPHFLTSSVRLTIFHNLTQLADGIPKSFLRDYIIWTHLSDCTLYLKFRSVILGVLQYQTESAN